MKTLFRTGLPRKGTVAYTLVCDRFSNNTDLAKLAAGSFYVVRFVPVFLVEWVNNRVMVIDGIHSGSSGFGDTLRMATPPELRLQSLYSQ